MKIAVRLDDITPDMDWERFLKFKALLDQYQVKPLIGVIPDNRDENIMRKTDLPREGQGIHIPENFWEYVKGLEKEGWVIAMHGFRHVYATKKGGLFPLNSFSEFAGVSYPEQEKMLSQGRKLLREKGIETDIFMAPAHSYDRNTLKALGKTGFTALTDGFGDKPYRWQGLTFYPISFQLSRSLEKKDGYSTMVVHTGTLSAQDFKNYQRYFEKDSVQWISYREYMAQEAAERGFGARWKEYFMAKGKHLLVSLRSPSN